jgi:putative transposase
VRDQIVDFVRRWSKASEIGAGRFVGWLGVTASKFYDWRERYGRANEHNGWVPRDFWLEEWEKEAIVNFHLKNPVEGYRRLTFMMLDADVVAVSPSSVWRVLSQAGLLRKWKGTPSKKGTGFEQPAEPHRRHVLLLVQRSGRVQPVDRALGSARVDDGGRHRDHSPSRQGEAPGGEAADHLR